MSNRIKVDIEGFQELTNKIKLLSDDKDKRRESLAILRQIAKPTLQVSKSIVPVSKNKHYSRGKFIQPGNLKKSLGLITGRSSNPTIIVGARAKRKFDGWYAHFVHEGHEYFAGASKSSKLFFKNNSRFTTVRNNSKGSANNKTRKTKKERAVLRQMGKARMTKPQPFLTDAFNQTKGQVTTEAEKKFSQFIQKRINKLGR